MGFFSSKKKTYVASSVFNLAGDIEDTTDYLKFVVGSSVLVSSNNLASDIVGGMLHGPASTQNKFLKWANREYTLNKITTSISNDELQNPAALVPFITARPNQTVWVQGAFIGKPDPELFAEAYLAENHPRLLEEDWTWDYDDVGRVLRIRFANPANNRTVLMPLFNRNGRYIYARYMLSERGQGSTTAVPIRTRENLTSIRQVPITSDYSVGPSTSTMNTPITLNRNVRVITEYRDNRPRTVNNSPSTYTGYYNRVESNYFYSTYRGRKGDNPQTITERYTLVVLQTHRIRNRQTREQTYGPEGEVITTIRSEQYVEPIWSYVQSRSEAVEQEMDGPYVFIYEIGTGRPLLDRLTRNVNNDADIFPVIPLRWENKFIDHPDLEEEYYEPVRQAFRKATNKANLGELLDQLKDNENIDDVDYIYLMFGVSLNELDNASGRYIYQFMKDLIPYQNTSKSEFAAYYRRSRAENQVGITWDNWNKVITLAGGRANTAAEPVRPVYESPKRTNLLMQGEGSALGNFNMFITWVYVDEMIFAGRGRRGAKRGDVWMRSEPYPIELGATANDVDTNALIATGSGRGNIFDIAMDMASGSGLVYLYYQYDNNMYRRLEIAGMEHNNYVYGGKAVTIKAGEALRDDEPSGFIVPMNYPTLKRLSLVDQNQVATRNKVLVMNSYQVVKTRWYQRGIFKFVISILLVVGAFFIMGPAAFAAAPGILGTNAAVGAMLGLSAVAGSIAGAAANAIAAMILISVIQDVAVKVFGEKFGAIIAAVATFAIMQGGINFTGPNAGINPVNWSEMFRVENLMKLTDPIMAGVQGVINGEMGELGEDYESLMDTYNKDMSEIEQMTRDNLGSSTGLNPMLMTDSVRNGLLREPSSSFLARTLMTGSEIADLSMGMIDRFVDATLALKGPFN